MQLVTKAFCGGRYRKITALGRSIIEHRICKRTLGASNPLGIPRWRQILRVPANILLNHKDLFRRMFRDISKMSVSKQERG